MCMVVRLSYKHDSTSVHQVSMHWLAISTTLTSKHPNEDTRNNEDKILMTKCSLSIQHMLHCNPYPNCEVTRFYWIGVLFSCRFLPWKKAILQQSANICNHLYIHQSCQQEDKGSEKSILSWQYCVTRAHMYSLFTEWLSLLQGQHMLNLPAVTNMEFFSLQALWSQYWTGSCK